jgi:hypothetical protein
VASSPRVLVLDDGELSRIRGFLAGYGISLKHLRGDVEREDLEGPYDLVIASVKRTIALEDVVDLASLPGKPVWIAVHAQDFLPLRIRLRRMGVRYLVQSSVGSEALRLLLVHSLYQGAERRDTLRLPVGVPVTGRTTSGEEFRAELLDLARSGCRLFAEAELALDAGVVVDLPAKLAGGQEVALPGRVSRIEPHPGTPRLLATIEFSDLGAEAVELLEAILAGRVIGTVVTRLGDELGSDAAPLTIPASAQRDGGVGDAPSPASGAFESMTTPAGPTPRESAVAPTPALNAPPRYPHERTNRRAPYSRKVTALLAGGTQVILGRDLSIAGMRAEPLPEFALGTELELAIYGASGAEPVLVKAIVARDDGELGTVFRFTGMPDWERPRLEDIVGSISKIQSLAEGEPVDTVVVTGLLESGSPSPRRR